MADSCGGGGGGGGGGGIPPDGGGGGGAGTEAGGGGGLSIVSTAPTSISIDGSSGIFIGSDGAIDCPTSALKRRREYQLRYAKDTKLHS